MFSFKSKRPLIISGPCSAESREQLLETCRALAAEGCVDIFRAGVWKPRTKPGSFEGAGEPALEWLAEAKRETGIPFMTEVANREHVELALKHGADAVWIGARTTVSPFSVQEIADALRGSDIPVLVKNPMNPDLDLWQGAVQRLLAVGVKEVGLIHRGFSLFGASEYRNNPMWHVAIDMKRRMPDLVMICDPSHICGKRELLEQVSQKSADMHFDGLIVESHICPSKALSDSEQQLEPADLGKMVRSLKWREDSVDSVQYQDTLAELRGQIDQLDSVAFEVLSKRMQVAAKIGQVKKDNNVSILQTGRWNDILERVPTMSAKLGISEDFIIKIFNAIHVESINTQDKIMNAKDE